MSEMYGFMRSFREILDGMDALAETCDEKTGEELEEINAEFEDTLMLLDGTEETADAREELDDAMEELEALAGDYRRLFGRVKGMRALVDRLEREIEGIRNQIS